MSNDTEQHIEKVQEYMAGIIERLEARAEHHDASKLEEPERSLFERISPQLSDLEYGSDEYMAKLDELQVAIDHHYRANRHHPEHWPDGVLDMSLIDLIEMLVDWKAASKRYKDKPFEHSLEFNVKRFNIPRGLALLMANTAEDLGWVDKR